MSNDIISDADRHAQEMIDNTQPENVDPIHPEVIDAPRAEPGVVDMPDVTEEEAEDVLTEERFVPRSFEEALLSVAGVEGMIRLQVRPELNFVVNMFYDDIYHELRDTANFEFNDQKLNLLQPFSKLNERSGRIGVLREPLRQFTETLGSLLSAEERIIVQVDTANLAINNVVSDYTRLAEQAVYSNFPTVEGEPVIIIQATEEGGEDTYLHAEEYVRVRSLIGVTPESIEFGEDENEARPDIRTVNVTMSFVVHVRIPLLVRPNQERFEKVIKTHFKYLQNCGIRAGMPTQVYAAYNTQELVFPSVQDSFNWIRENDEDLEILSYRNVEASSDFLGVHGFSADDYRDVMFNGGDFIVAFNLDQEGE